MKRWSCAVAVLIAACGGGGGTTVTQQVGSSGGSVVATDGSGVTIPAGALAAGTNVTVTSSPGAQAAPGTTAVGTTYLLGPEGTQFAVPVTVTLAVDLGKLPSGKTISDVIIYTAPKDTTNFVGLPTTMVDSTHVSAQTTHFSLWQPGVPTSTDCVLSCNFSGGQNCSPSGCTPISTASDCKATCMGHAYELSCTDTSCTCSKDGSQSGTTTTSSATDSNALLNAYNNGCGFPGALACDFSCTEYQSGTVNGGGTAPNGTLSDPSTSCSCTGTCMGQSYGFSCTDGSCTCGGSNPTVVPDAGVTGSGGAASLGGVGGAQPLSTTFSASCSDLSALQAAWSGQCGYPGTVAPPPIESSTSTAADGGAPSGGTVDAGTIHSGSSDAGVPPPPDMAVTCNVTSSPSGAGCQIMDPCQPGTSAFCNGTTCQCSSAAGPGNSAPQGMTCATQADAKSFWMATCGYPI